MDEGEHDDNENPGVEHLKSAKRRYRAKKTKTEQMFAEMRAAIGAVLPITPGATLPANEPRDSHLKNGF